MTGTRSNPQPLKNSILRTWFGLVAGTWIGLAWGSLLSAPLGLGPGVAAASAFGGFLVVPLWGTVWGFIGLRRQRESATCEEDIRLLDPDDPLAQRVYVLAGRLGLTTRPWVAVMPHSNAYAIGANADNALVVIGQPLLDAFGDAEVDAIIGHELGHVANNDMRRMGLAHSFQNALVWYLGSSDTLKRWVRWLLTWFSELLVLGLSRRREFYADAIGAALTSKADMIAALEKLHAFPDLGEFERRYARLMVRGVARGSLFSTHPTLVARRSALEAETYIRRIPLLMPLPAPTSQPATLPKAEDLAYARR